MWLGWAVRRLANGAIGAGRPARCRQRVVWPDGSWVAGAGLVLGAVVAPLPALAASPSNCITLWHTSGITTQTEYERNDCRSGTYGFRVYSA